LGSPDLDLTQRFPMRPAFSGTCPSARTMPLSTSWCVA